MNKNDQIKESGSKTRAKRRTQMCKTFKFKIDRSHLRKEQANALKMFFVETKRLYNYILSVNNIPDPKDYKDYYNISYLDKDKNKIDYKIQYIGSSIIQDQIRIMKESIKGLSTLKSKDHKVGCLKFKSECNSIRLFQYGITHKIVGNRIKIQGIKRPIKVSGLNQIKYNDIDFTTAHLLYDGINYYISLTCFVPKEEKEYKGRIGIDMGVSTHITLSDGRKFNVLIEESERLKRLQAVLAKKQTRSNNWYKVRSKIRKEYIKQTNKKNDIANKIYHELSRYEIVMQDEQITSWDKKTIQHSILGRLKFKLSKEAYMLDQWFPTTQYCPVCGSFTKHDVSKRTFECSCCHSISDRDIHAAQNMLVILDKIRSYGTYDLKPCKKIPFKKFEGYFRKEEAASTL